MALGQLLPPGVGSISETRSDIVSFLAGIFDPPNGRFSWKDCLPGAYDSVWAWTVDGEMVSALITRPMETQSGHQGIAIGLVGTSPDRRGEGFASALVGAVAEQCREQGGGFVMLWARVDLIGFYQSIGFQDRGGEDDCTVAVSSTDGKKIQSCCLNDFDDIPHKNFDLLRCNFQGQSAVARQFKNGCWHGLSGSRGGKLSIIFDGNEEAPTFYAVVAHGDRPPMILEFVGDADEFCSVVVWINANLSPVQVSYSLTSPNLARHLACVDVVNRKEVFHTMVLPFCGARPLVPATTWLDRV